MKKSYYIYKHTFPNNKVYIGITSKKPEYRWGKEGKEYWYSNRKMFYAIKKYGWNNIIHDILFNNLTKEEAHKKKLNSLNSIIQQIQKWDTISQQEAMVLTA